VDLAHRHPIRDQAGRRTLQPHTITFDVPATVTYEVVVDLDGTARLRAVWFSVEKDAIIRADAPASLWQAVHDLEVQPEVADTDVDAAYAAADETWDRVVEAAMEYHAGDCAFGDWTFRWPDPVLDEEGQA
jgi:cytochrome c556